MDGWEKWDTLAQRLKGCRTARGLTQEQVRDASGVSQSDLSKLERGEMLSSTKIPQLAKAYAVDSYWLSTGDGQPEPTPNAGLFVSEPWTEFQPVRQGKFVGVPVIGQGAGGELPERVWTDADFPVGGFNEYAEVISSDPHAFIVRVVGTSMVPKFTPGAYALVEPGTEPDIEDDVLVRLTNGQTMIKQLLSRRGHVRLGSYNKAHETLEYTKDEITWMYYVAYPVPARKIKNRV